MGLGWKNSYGTGVGDDAYTSGLEGAWTPSPIRWDNSFFETLFGYEWEKTKSPAGAWQWIPTDPAAGDKVPDPQDPAKKHPPVMLTTDLSLSACF
jgi:catalase-peroxidase